MARPTKYVASKHPELVEAWAAASLTDAEIAAKLGVSYATLRTWLAKHPEFLAAHKRGKARMLDRCEQGLYKRAAGYDYEEVSVTIEEFVSAKRDTPKWKALWDAKMHAEPDDHVYQVRRTTTRKHVPADVAANALVLCNRRPPGYDPDDKAAGWRHVQRIEHTGEGGGAITIAELVRGASEG